MALNQYPGMGPADQAPQVGGYGSPLMRKRMPLDPAFWAGQPVAPGNFDVDMFSGGTASMQGSEGAPPTGVSPSPPGQVPPGSGSDTTGGAPPAPPAGGGSGTGTPATGWQGIGNILNRLPQQVRERLQAESRQIPAGGGARYNFFVNQLRAMNAPGVNHLPANGQDAFDWNAWQRTVGTPDGNPGSGGGGVPSPRPGPQQPPLPGGGGSGDMNPRLPPGQGQPGYTPPSEGGGSQSNPPVGGGQAPPPGQTPPAGGGGQSVPPGQQPPRRRRPSVYT